ncbi:lysozyme inhibitor LprI family protein [Neorhizobium galegae]|uniref:lysozyme inhibitor LprI family protein n=1 Tax=Neorhizobium galegae TaxID=399 RepID=UPI001F358E60|nr:lysozyme inhibitor LprI family protein [Neorhizobium galegae]UIK04056.1 lysozyme inhibitor LprI family protein [Neorhizobium galegae]
MKSVFAAAAAFLGFCALSAFAQEPKANCKNPQTQIEMNICSQRDYDAADKALNAQYQTTRKAMKAWDADAMSELKGAEDALVKAQRAWVAYRDAQCISTGFQAHGGSMVPMLISGCQADLTRKRTAELKELTEAMGN